MTSELSNEDMLRICLALAGETSGMYIDNQNGMRINVCSMCNRKSYKGEDKIENGEASETSIAIRHLEECKDDK